MWQKYTFNTSQTITKIHPQTLKDAENNQMCVCKDQWEEERNSSGDQEKQVNKERKTHRNNNNNMTLNLQKHRKWLKTTNILKWTETIKLNNPADGRK